MAIAKSSEAKLENQSEIISPLHSQRGLEDDIVLTTDDESLEEKLKKKKRNLENTFVEPSDSSQDPIVNKEPKISEETVTNKASSVEIEKKDFIEKDNFENITTNQEAKKSPNTKAEITSEDEEISTNIDNKTSVAKGISKLYKKHFDDALEYAKRPTTRLLNAYFATAGLIVAGYGVAISAITGGILAPIGALYVGYGAVITPIAGREVLDPEYAAKNIACGELAKELGIKGMGKYTIPFTKAHKEKQQLLKIIEAKGEIEESNCESFGVSKDFFNKVALGLQKVQEREEQEKALKVTTALALGKEIDSKALGVEQEFVDKVKANLSKQTIVTVSDEKKITDEISSPKHDDKPSTSINVEEVEHTASSKITKANDEKPETHVERVKKEAAERTTNNNIQVQ